MAGRRSGRGAYRGPHESLGIELGSAHFEPGSAWSRSRFRIRAADVFRRTLARATDLGLEVRGWGIGTDEDLEKLFDLGSVGATVDWPGRAIELIKKRGIA